MNLNNTKLTIDGQEVRVKDVKIDYSAFDELPTVSVEGYFMPQTLTTNMTMATDAINFDELTKTLLKSLNEDEGCEMGRCDEDKACAEGAVCDNGVGNVVRRVKELSLSDEDRLLRKYGIVYEDGELSSRGKELLFVLLFEDYKDTVVEKLQELEPVEPEE